MLLHKDNNFIGLLIGQLILIFSMPALHYFDAGLGVESGLGKFILHMAFIGMMLITIIGNKGNKQWINPIKILAALEVFIFILAMVLDDIFLTYVAISLSLFFLISSTAVAFKSVFYSQKITLNHLVGASCIYLLLGIIWSILYANLYFFYPDSFSGLTEKTTRLHFSEFMYYSYVTLTTLGFGDITPISPFAKTLSFMQAVTGQLYLTIMVAGLIGKAINSNHHP